jgi:2-polyprenyl-3-methyl-5-hydroxy-6-metoxy-1,4-benzoquinol methylase
MKKSPEQQIVSSWHKNVTPWIAAIHKGEIESRVLVTNKAIINAIVSRSPKTLLDVGCGEGWLVRELVNQGIDALGVDVVREFIVFSQTTGAGRFRTLAYEDISATTLNEKFDAVVCNFSLLGNVSVINLLQQLPSILNEAGALIIQTLHPVVSCGEHEYADSWRDGSWSGFSETFTDPAPWYFRTVESWIALLQEKGYNLLEVREPVNPYTQLPASIIFIATC